MTQRIAVVGSRDFPDRQLVEDVMHSIAIIVPDAVIVSGGARGVDAWAAHAAAHSRLKVVVHAPNWSTHGKGAGLIRNQRIVDDCDSVVAFWDGESNGTRDTIGRAQRAGKSVTIFERRREGR